MIRIDLATVEDIGRLANLLELLFALEDDFRPDREKQEQGLRMIIEGKEVGRIFVAREDEWVVGMVSLLFTVSTAEGGRVCWLEDMVVEPEKRGGGLGSRLVAAAVEFARLEEFKRITLLTDGTNEGAIRFYERQGFVRSEMSVLRMLL